MGGEAIVFPADVADAQELDCIASQVEERGGPIDVWVNNAMVGVLSPVKEMEPEEYKRVTEVTYLGQVYGTQAALKRMLPRNKGSIVLVGSALLTGVYRFSLLIAGLSMPLWAFMIRSGRNYCMIRARLRLLPCSFRQ